MGVRRRRHAEKWKAQDGGQAYGLLMEARAAQLRGEYQRCVALTQQALRLGGMTPWQTSMTYNLLAYTLRRICRPQEAAEMYLRSAQMRGSSPAGDDALALQDYSNYLFTLHYLPLPARMMAEAARGYGAFFEGVQAYAHDKGRHQHEKVRIGYISPDLRFHVVTFFSIAMLESYDRSRFEVYCYASCEEDATSRRIAAAVDGWRNIRGLSPREAAARVYADEIDILFDLSGHTADTCLPVLAYRPAPVQMSGIGWFGSTGLSTVDYFLVDEETDPPGKNEAAFTEKFLRLPHSHFCYRWHDDDALPTGAAPCLQNGFVTFGSFNVFAKASDRTLTCWAEILSRVPESRLLLKTATFCYEDGRQAALQRLQAAGIDPARVTLEGAERQYLSAYHRVDIALDSFPYPGGGTTCDALYMGVPVVTRVGERHGARFGGSLLKNAGLSELCAETDAAYVEIAVTLAQAPARIRNYHQRLRRQLRMSPVMDDGLYMAELEEGYLAIWRRWQRGEAAAHTEVRKLMEDISPEDALRRGRAYVCAEEAAAGLSRLVCRKRAAYWLARAKGGSPAEGAERLLLLAEAREGLLDFAGAREAADAAAALAARVPYAKQRRLWETQARLALHCGDVQAALASFTKAFGCAEERETRAPLYSTILRVARCLPLSAEDFEAALQGYADIFSDVERTHASGSLLANQTITQTQEAALPRKVRVGLLSAAFCMQERFPLSYGYLLYHDRAHFEVTAYHLGAAQDAFTEAVQQQAEHFVHLHGMSYEAAAARIRADGIDVLVNLDGHSTGAGLPLLAWRPAPVQIAGGDARGLPWVDACLGDAVLDTESAVNGVPGTREAVHPLPTLCLPSRFCYVLRSDLPSLQGRAPEQDRHRPIVFGVVAPYARITDEMLLLWQEILAAVPGSRLHLLAPEFASDTLVDAAFSRLQALGFSADALFRVCFLPREPGNLAPYLAMDILLDPYPCTGDVATFEALSMGVPVVTRDGTRRDTRVGRSILASAGIGELTAETADGYVARAVALAKDRELLETLHQNLRQMLQRSAASDPRPDAMALEQQVLAFLRKKKVLKFFRK